jgi:phosphinothricin acetyltransferase
MQTPNLAIRPATADDLAAINDIYNHYVLHSTATYQEKPEPMDGRRGWFERHGPAHPVTVAEAGGAVVGWASLSPFHARSAYRRTVENSVYVHPDYHRRGIGRALLLDLIERARGLGHHTIIAGIDAEQPASVALHARLGFVQVAHLKQVGHKFGRWLDVVYMQLML